MVVRKLDKKRVRELGFEPVPFRNLNEEDQISNKNMVSPLGLEPNKYRNDSNKRPASLKCPSRIVAQANLKTSNQRPYPIFEC